MIHFGIDNLIASGADKRLRLGLITNDAATTTTGEKSRVALRSAGFNLVRLFSPEHGLSATAEDGAAVADARDPLTDLPVVSLYGQTTRPPLDALRDLDVLLFDIPDVGARFYTYIWTLSHALEAAAEAQKPLWVLDRPNPIGGDLGMAEGPMLDESFVSTFVGRWTMPVRHCMTVGELARYWNSSRNIACDLRVIECTGWQRHQHWPDLNLPFIPPSPAIRDYQTALVYPGTCLLEGTNISEGRGTVAPFRLIGAPWIDPHALAAAMHEHAIPGVRIEPATFTPTDRKYVTERCGGLELTVTDPHTFRPVAFGLLLIATIAALYPQHFTFSPYPTAANESGGGHFDRLIGRRDVREVISQQPQDVQKYLPNWIDSRNWTASVEQSQVYPESTAPVNPPALRKRYAKDIRWFGTFVVKRTRSIYIAGKAILESSAVSDAILDGIAVETRLQASSVYYRHLQHSSAPRPIRVFACWDLADVRAPALDGHSVDIKIELTGPTDPEQPDATYLCLVLHPPSVTPPPSHVHDRQTHIRGLIPRAMAKIERELIQWMRQSGTSAVSFSLYGGYAPDVNLHPFKGARKPIKFATAEELDEFFDAYAPRRKKG